MRANFEDMTSFLMDKYGYTKKQLDDEDDIYEVFRLVSLREEKKSNSFNTDDFEDDF